MLEALSFVVCSMLMVSLLMLVVIACLIGRMRMFQKAGIAGWKAFIPFYRDYVLCEMTMGKGWYFLFGFVPVLAPVMRVLYSVEVTLSFERELLFAVLYFFFPWACELYLGLSSASYMGAQDLDEQLHTLFGSAKRCVSGKKTYAKYREVSPEEAQQAEKAREDAKREKTKDTEKDTPEASGEE